MSKPTILIIPGAFHPSSSMDPFVKPLHGAGFPVEVKTLRSLDDAAVGLDVDEAYVKAALTALIDGGRDVVLLVHSFAGMVATAAVSGLDKTSREARGYKSGLLGIIYLAAFLPGKTTDSLEVLRDSPPAPWAVLDVRTASITFCVRNHLSGLFYNDCDPEIADAVAKSLKPHSLKAFGGFPSTIGYKEAGFLGRRAYIRCIKDHAILLADQDRFLAQSGVEFIVKTLDSSHSPFLSMPEELTRVVEEIVVDFVAAGGN